MFLYRPPSKMDIYQHSLAIITIFTVIVFTFRILHAEENDNYHKLKDYERLNGNGKECTIFKDYGANELSVNDVFAKSNSSNLVCIKAKFSLAMKVEAIIDRNSGDRHNVDETENVYRLNNEDKVDLGYIPLDSVVKVENNCYDLIIAESLTDKQNEQQTAITPDAKELQLKIEFDCGRLTFTFCEGETNYFVSSIKGVVKLDSYTEIAFESNKPVFATKDLVHHFKYDPLIEVSSEAIVGGYNLIANFYKTEIEAFRNTTSIEFILPPEREVLDEYSHDS